MRGRIAKAAPHGIANVMSWDTADGPRRALLFDNGGWFVADFLPGTSEEQVELAILQNAEQLDAVYGVVRH